MVLIIKKNLKSAKNILKDDWPESLISQYKNKFREENRPMIFDSKKIATSSIFFKASFLILMLFIMKPAFSLDNQNVPNLPNLPNRPNRNADQQATQAEKLVKVISTDSSIIVESLKNEYLTYNETQCDYYRANASYTKFVFDHYKRVFNFQLLSSACFLILSILLIFVGLKSALGQFNMAADAFKEKQKPYADTKSKASPSGNEKDTEIKISLNEVVIKKFWNGNNTPYCFHGFCAFIP